MDNIKYGLLSEYGRFYGQMNEETRCHSIGVAELCEAAAAELGLDPQTAYTIGFLHDVGKIYIPSRIMRKNGKLSPIEREVMDMHSYYGYRMICNKVGAEISLPVLYHHGFNKPKLQEAKEQVTDGIMSYIRLVHCADIYDALAKKRSYHKPYAQSVIVSILKEDSMCSSSLIRAVISVVQERNIVKCPVILTAG